MKKYTFYEDPGHGWLKVPTLEVAKLDIGDLISTCSYIEPCGKNMYLEEDMDMGTFLTAKIGPYDKETDNWRKWFAANVYHDDSATNAPGRDARCRSFPNFNPKREAA